MERSAFNRIDEDIQDGRRNATGAENQEKQSLKEIPLGQVLGGITLLNQENNVIIGNILIYDRRIHPWVAFYENGRFRFPCGESFYLKRLEEQEKRAVEVVTVKGRYWAKIVYT